MRKKRNIRREIAKKNYIDPDSDSYLNMTRSMIKAGYSDSYSKVYGGRVLEKVNFTDVLPKEVGNPQQFAQKCYNVLLKLVNELESTPKLTKVSAKYIAEIRRTLELLAKMFGMMKPEIKREEIVKIEIPREIVEEEYRRRGK